jgi:hypothetical protein
LLFLAGAAAAAVFVSAGACLFLLLVLLSVLAPPPVIDRDIQLGCVWRCRSSNGPCQESVNAKHVQTHVDEVFDAVD